MILIPCAFIATFLTVITISPFFTKGVEPVNLLPTTLAIFLAWTYTAYFCFLAYGFRIIIDETGIHRYFFGRVKHSLLWRYIRSFGINVIPAPSRCKLAFYASTEAKLVDYKSKEFIRLNPSDEQAIRASGLLTFCRTQMAEADRKFK